MTSLLLLRHGQSTWNAEGRWQGWADAPLSPLGEQQARDAVEHLRGAGVTRACASDLQRARRTAQLLAEGLALGGVVVEPDLRERNVGSFTGLAMDDIRARWPQAFHPDTDRLLSVPDGEDDGAFRDRVIPALVSLAERFVHDTLLVVSHGGVIRTIERYLGIEPPASTPNLGGRWFHVHEGILRAGDPVTEVDPEHASAPATE